MDNLQTQIDNLKTLQESYDELVEQTSAVGLATKEIEASKNAMVEAINAQGGTATEQMGIAQLAQAIGTIPNIQLGGVEFDVPVSSVAQAIALLPSNCTKLVDNWTEATEYLNQIPVGWQKLEEVEFNALRIIDFRELELGSQSQYKILTDCPSLKSIKMDNLHEIINTYANVVFFTGKSITTISMQSLLRISSNPSSGTNNSQILTGLSSLTSLSMPSITSISSSSSNNNNASQILSGLSSLTSLSMPVIISISSSCYSSGYNDTKILSGLSSLTSLSLPSLTSISDSGGVTRSSQILSGLSSLTSLSLPSLTSISSNGLSTGSGIVNNTNILTGLSSLTSLSLPAITNISSSVASSIGINSSQILSGCTQLEYIEIGHTTDGVGSITGNMRLNINPTVTYEDAEKLAALNASIRDHWFANLCDYTGGTAHTLTLMSNFVNHLEPETIQVATDKNWTIVTF